MSSLLLRSEGSITKIHRSPRHQAIRLNFDSHTDLRAKASNDHITPACANRNFNARSGCVRDCAMEPAQQPSNAPRTTPSASKMTKHESWMA